jgi:hypothetical protein
MEAQTAANAYFRSFKETVCDEEIARAPRRSPSASATIRCNSKKAAESTKWRYKY